MDDEGNVTFTPEEGFTGEASIPYTATDSDGNPLPPAEITVSVSQLVDDEASTPLNTPVTFNIAENDGDINPATIDLNPDRNGVQKTRRVPGQGTFEVDAEGNVTFTPEDGFIGEVSIPYTARDANGNRLDPAEITVSVSPIADDEASTPPGEPVTFNIAENDGDIDPASIDLDPDTPGIQKEITVPGQGTFEVDDEGNVTFTPEEGFTGEASIPYTATDSDGNPLPPAEITVSVSPLVDDEASTPVNTPVTFNIAENDGDIDPTSIDLNPDRNGIQKTRRVPGQGTFEVDDEGNVTFTPEEGFTGEASIPYTATDSDGNPLDPAEITVSVSPIADDEASTPPGEPVTFNIAENDGDIDPASIDLDPDTPGIQKEITVPGQGTFEVDDEGNITFTPEEGFVGEASIPYTANDSDGNPLPPAEVTVSVASTDNPPEAVDDSATTPVNTPVTLDVLSNDSDPDEDTLTVTQVNDDAENGTVTLNDDGTVTYTPNAGFTGEDTFTYEISDGNGGTDTATVTVTIEESSPLDDTASTPPDEPIVIDVLNNDSIGNDDRPLRIISFTQPENGTVELDDNGTPDDPTDDKLIYTPNPGFEGIDTFTYTISDPQGNEETPTVNVKVDPNTPLAEPDITKTEPDVPVTIDVLGNDSDPNEEPLSILSFTQPARGTVTIDDNGTPDDPTDDRLIYTPNPGFEGTDTFTYTVVDPDGNEETATVNVTVGPAGAPPTGTDDIGETLPGEPVTLDVFSNDSDDPVVAEDILIDTLPENGTVTVNEDGTITYTPDPDFIGVEEFTYQIMGEDGELSDPITVTVYVGVEPDVAETVAGEPVIIDVLENDTADGVPTISQQPENGTVVVNEDGTVTYTPNPDFSGEDTFFYTLTVDGEEISEPVSVTVDVTPASELPVGEPDSATTNIGEPVIIDVLENDSQTGTVGIAEQPENGTVVVNEDGTVTYTPNEDFTGGEDTFTYTITGENGEVSEPVEVTVSVEPAPELPVGEPDSATTVIGEPVIIDVQENDSQTGTVEISEQPENGTVVVNEDGTVTYTPNEGFTGEDIFYYTITGEGGEVSEPIEVSVDTQPVGEPDSVTTQVGAPIIIDVLENDSISAPVEIAEQPENGTVVVNEDGTVTYTPNAGFTGEDTFTYTITGGDDVLSEPIEVSVQVQAAAVNNPVVVDTPVVVQAAGEPSLPAVVEEAPPEVQTTAPPVETPDEPQDKTCPPPPTIADVDMSTPPVLTASANRAARSINDGDEDGRIEGGEAGEEIVGNDGNDFIWSGDGDDDVYGGIGNDTIYGEQGSDFINGKEDQDQLQAGKGNDRVRGGKGNDVAFGEIGDDIILGEKGDDILWGGALDSRDTEGEDRISGGEGNDLIGGNQGRDILTGDQGNDELRGGKQQDDLHGGDGNDTIMGEKGDDMMLGDFTQDLGLRDALQAGANSSSESGQDLLLGGEGNDTGHGGRGEDSVQGGKGDDFLYGGKDNDWMRGEIGNDTLKGQQGDDTMYGGTQVNSDFEGNDVLFGGAGNDELHGNYGNDSIVAGADNDVAFGGKNDDFIWGEAGADILLGDDGNDTICGGDDNDTIYGDDLNSSQSVGVNGQRDLLFGGQGDDLILGNEGEDEIYGEDGNDILIGGFDNDTLIGGAGNDSFVLNPGEGSDVIHDFNTSEDALLLGYGLTFEQLVLTQGVVGTEIRFNDELLATLEEVQLNQLTADRFSSFS